MPRTIRWDGLGSARALVVALSLALASIGTIAASSQAPASAARATNTNPYIVNGAQISLSQVPFQAAILDRRYGDDSDPAAQFECGGEVLTSRLVLTAGHCTYYDLGNGLQETAANLRVLVNTGNLSSGGTAVDVTAIHRNPGYDPTKSDSNDLALLSLASPIATTPVAVVPPQSDYRWTSGATGFVSGWGCDVDNSECENQSDYPNLLRGTSLTVHTNSYCEGRYSQYNIDFDPATMLCAGNPSASAAAPGPCFGDSGGPLTVPGYRGQRLLVGLVSWGVVCGGESTAFTRVATYRSWLQSFGVPITAPPLTVGPSRQLLAGARPIAGDFNGDGNTDILAYRPGSASDALYRNVNGGTASVPVSLSGNYHSAVCDVNNDGRDDVILVAPGTAADYVLFGAAAPGTFTSKQLFAINSNYIPIAGDFNGDGKCDLILYQPGSGPDHEYLGVGNGTFTAGPSINVSGNYIPIVGDFNGDGRADILWYAPGTGTDYLRLGKTNGTFADGAPVTINGSYTPVAGDFNGDHRTDILWYGSGNATDSLWYASGSSFTQGPDVTVGGDYTAVTGDFNGAGKDDIAWMSASGLTSLWFGK
ncbi:MAG TPA: FG-GAP-like repeat-containing protein [Acidimicrobiia bacterium]|jgi:secreted trypsin-like serine protease